MTRMRSIQIINEDSDELLNNVISGMKNTNPNKQLLEVRKVDILERYSMYRSNLQELSRMGTDSIIRDAHEKEALIKCYTRNGNTRFGKIANRILAEESEKGRSSCPYCELTDSSRLDHYIPKGLMPEYSLMIENLIPSCCICNEQYKKELWLSNGKRIFFNPYWDKWLKYKFVYAEVIDGEVPILRYSIKRPNEITEEQFEIIKSHFVTLQLQKRYESKVSEEITFQLEKFQRYYSKMKNKMNEYEIVSSYKENVCEDRDIYYEICGINHWKTCFYEAIVESRMFFKVNEYIEVTVNDEVG